MPRKATHSRSSAAVLLAGLLLALSAASTTHAATGAPATGNTPADFPTLSTEPALARRQAVGCSVVGLGLTGLALASGFAATGGGAAAASGSVVPELLAYFGAGCTIGAFIATAFPMGNAPPETTPARLPDAVRPAQLLRLQIEAAELP